MAVAHDAATESHTSTTGHSGSASFTWDHTGGGSARSALVFVCAISATNPITSVTYGGTTMTAVPYTAIDSDTEPGAVKAYFLDNCGTGTKAVVVNRSDSTPWTTVMYAVCATQTAARATEVYNPGIITYGGSSSNTGASTSGTGTATLTVASPTDASPGSNSVRYAIRYVGAASPGDVYDGGSTLLNSIDFTSYGIAFVRETTAGQGARSLGFSTATDDTAAIFLAVRELAVTNAAAVLASATGTVPGGTSSPSPAAALASATAAASNATVTTSSSGTYADAVLASATGSGLGATANAQPAASIGSATGTANAVVANVKPSAGVASATGTASQPTLTLLSNANAGVAAATGAAPGATANVKPSAGAGTGTGAAPGATANARAAAGVGSATGTAPGAAEVVAPSPAAAASTGTASNATVTTAGGTNAAAGVASATASAGTSVVTIGAAAGTAAGTGTAPAPTVDIAPMAGSVTGTGTAYNATVTTSTFSAAGAGPDGFASIVRPEVGTVRLGWPVYSLGATHPSQFWPLLTLNSLGAPYEEAEGNFLMLSGAVEHDVPDGAVAFDGPTGSATSPRP